MNDYFLLFNDLFAVVCDSCKLVISKRIESDHMPVELYLRSLKEKEFTEDNEDVYINKFVWNPSNVQTFKDSFNSDEARTRFKHAINMIDVDINNALQVFNSSIKEMAECMAKINIFS